MAARIGFRPRIRTRQTSDAVTALGAGVDGTVRLHATSYNGQGQVYQMTAYASPSGGAVLNQVQDVYNGLGQLTGEYQSHGGAVSTASTPEVQYVHSDPTTGSRQTETVYPNGRTLHQGYDGNALDNAVGRVDYLADDNGGGGVGGHLADYQYLGSGTVVSQADGNGVALSYLQQPGDTQAVADGGDQVTGLDRFGRVIDQNYVNTATGQSTDRFQTGYDRDSNVLYKNNLVNGSWSELYHANSTSSGDNNGGYDPLNRLTAFSRGALSASGNNGSSGPGSPDTISSPSHSQTWGLDALGNQTAVTTDGTTVANTTNGKNELTSVGSSALAFDNAGDTTTDEQGRHLAYDAWDQPVSVKDASGNPIATYTTDAAGRRITQAAGTGPATDLYYSGGNVLEERQGLTVTTQNVWGVTYANDLVLRDDNSTSGSLGISGSGLGRRLYAQHDANFDTTALTDASGNVVERFAYDPYGSAMALTPTWSPTADLNGCEYLFQGMRYDSGTGLYTTPNREYSPVLGRWMQQDPAGYVNGPNRCEYCGANPTSVSDPSGLEWKRQDGLPAPRAKWCASNSSDTWAELAKLTHFDEKERDKWLGERVEGNPTVAHVYTVPNTLYKVKGLGDDGAGNVWNDADLTKMLEVGVSEFTGATNNYFIVDKPVSNMFAAIDDPNIAVIVAAGHGTHDTVNRGGKDVQLQGLMVTDKMRDAVPNVLYPVDALAYLHKARGYHLAGMTMVVCSAGSGGWASLVSPNGTLWANDEDIKNNWILEKLHWRGGRDGWEPKTFGLKAHTGSGTEAWTIPSDKPQPGQPFVPSPATQPSPR